MKVTIFGLGYVGTVSAGCLANAGHEVIGVDPVQTKVDLINNGHSPIIEADIGEIIASTVQAADCAPPAMSRKRSRRQSYLSFASALQASPMATSISVTFSACANKSARR